MICTPSYEGVVSIVSSGTMLANVASFYGIVPCTLPHDTSTSNPRIDILCHGGVGESVESSLSS